MALITLAIRAILLLVLLNKFVNGLPVGSHGYWIDFQKPLPGGNGTFLVLQVMQQHNSLVKAGIFLLWIEFYDPVEKFNGYFRITIAAVHDPQVGQDIGVVR